MNYNEFADKIKAKYPGSYDDLDNKTLAQKMVAKHPEYSDVTFEESAPKSQNQPSMLNNIAGAVSDASPINMGNTVRNLVRKGADLGGEAVAEDFAQKGMNPNVAAGIGTTVQMLPDIAESIAAGPMTKAITSGVKATGPFTAGLKDPSTAAWGALDEAGAALGKAKTTARAGEDLAEASRLRSLLLKGKGGIVKVAEEGKKVMDNAQDASVTHLLAYREGLGKAQKLGGSFANDYKVAFEKASAALEKKAPDLMQALKKYNLVSLAKEGEEFSVPFLETAINPAVGAVKAGYKMTQMAPVRNLAGAATNATMRTAPTVMNAGMTAYDKFFNKKKRK